MAIGRIPEPGTGIPESIIAAKGDLIAGTANDTPGILTAGSNETRLVADSSTATGLKYVADTTNYAIAAKGDLLVGTGADTLAALTVGTNGHTLVADSATATGLKWAAASSGALTLINTTTITGAVASQSINDVFTSTYDDYLIISSLTMATWAGSLGYRLRVSGSDTTSNYRHSRVYLSSGSAGWTNGNNTNSGTAMALADVSGTTDQMRSVIWVLRPNLAAKTYSIAQTQDFDGTNTYMTQSQGIQTDTTQFTGITFLGTNSNISSGTISIYGVSK